MKAILDKPEYGLIWRPHPLLSTMLEARFPQCLAYVQDLEKRIEEADNCVIDRSGDYRAAFSCSDALHGKAFANLDGTAGEKIYAYLKDYVTNI